MKGSAIASLALLASAFGAEPQEPHEPSTWRFRVSLGERALGTHVFRVDGEGGARMVSSEARFGVKLWFVQAYRYTHTATERWNGDCLERIDARTDDNGKRRRVSGRAHAGTFEVTTDRAPVPQSMDACVMSFAYWNPRILSQRSLLNAQTGELTPVRIDTLGTEDIRVRGTPTRASRYAIIAGTFRIDVWYADVTREWVRLETRTGRPGEDGRRLIYDIE